MSVMKRMSMIFKSKANRALDRMEDPRETLDYSYQRQLEMLQQVRRGVADVATSRKRLELQINQKEREQQKLTDQAKVALQKGREDLAREALSRRGAADSQLGELRQQFASLQGDEEKLTLASQRLQSKVDSFRTRKETLKATYTAAEAQTKINEAFSGISEEMGDVGLAIQRAEEKTQNMQARAGAIDELLASGALEDYSGPRDDIQTELDRMGASGPGVDLELERLKAEIDQGEAPKQLDPGAGGGEAKPAQQEDAARPQQAQNPPQPGGAQ